jgi:hypothetical protein
MCLELRKGAFDKHTNILLEAMFVAAFYGFFRCGELTIQSYFDPEYHLTCEDIFVEESCIKIFLKQSKTDRFHKGTTITLHMNQTKICPVKALCMYMKIRNFRNALPKDPFFVTNCHLPVTRTYFIEYLKNILERIGYDSSKYNGHSFRIGAATSAASARMEDHLIKTLGRWSSDCYRRYIRTSEDVVKNAQCSLATGTGNTM